MQDQPALCATDSSECMGFVSPVMSKKFLTSSAENDLCSVNFALQAMAALSWPTLPL